MLTRAIFLHTQRVSDLIITLQFDKFLDPIPEQTYIFYGPFPLDYDLRSKLESYNIDTSKFIIKKDYEMWPKNLPVDIYKFGGWISQQFIKFIALDYLESADVVLIQDCDTFNIRSYNWVDNQGNITLYGLPNTSQSPEYYRYVKQLTGQPKQTSYSFVSEFMPVLRDNWNELKIFISTTYHKSWLEVFYDIFDHDSQFVDQIWFSEYELLGNWALKNRSNTRIINQDRLRLTSNWRDNIGCIAKFNCICNDSCVDFADINEFVEMIKSKIG